MRAIQPTTRQLGDHLWLIGFLKQLRREDLSPMTVRGYQSDLRLFLRWYASPELEKLTAVDILNYRRHLSGGGLKPASINRKLEALRRLCRWAHGEGKLTVNPAAEVKLARTMRDLRPAGLTGVEVTALLRAAGQSSHGLSKRNYALLQLVLQTGVRVSEAAALRVRDVMLRERAGSVKVRGKGDKEREVPLNTSARRGLSAYLDTRRPLRPDDPLITSETGAAISVRSIQSVVAELARRAKITRLPVTAHSMRHTFALNYLERNPGKLVETRRTAGTRIARYDRCLSAAFAGRDGSGSGAQPAECRRVNPPEKLWPYLCPRTSARRNWPAIGHCQKRTVRRCCAAAATIIDAGLPFSSVCFAGMAGF